VYAVVIFLGIIWFDMIGFSSSMILWTRRRYFPDARLTYTKMPQKRGGNKKKTKKANTAPPTPIAGSSSGSGLPKQASSTVDAAKSGSDKGRESPKKDESAWDNVNAEIIGRAIADEIVGLWRSIDFGNLDEAYGRASDVNGALRALGFGDFQGFPFKDVLEEAGCRKGEVSEDGWPPPLNILAKIHMTVFRSTHEVLKKLIGECFLDCLPEMALSDEMRARFEVAASAIEVVSRVIKSRPVRKRLAANDVDFFFRIVEFGSLNFEDILGDAGECAEEADTSVRAGRWRRSASPRWRIPYLYRSGALRS